MLSRHLLLCLFAFCFGTGVSGGTFAFLLVIGVIPRMLGRFHRAANYLLIENVMIAGILCGTIASVFQWQALAFSVWIARVLLILYGLSAGIFVGCIAVALAESLQIFPIIFRRFQIHRGLSLAVTGMALGKMLGALIYFLTMSGSTP